MSLADVVRVSITRETAGIPTQIGFGTPLIMSFHENFIERVREYSSVDAMLTDGFSSTDPAVLKATKIFSQNPRPDHVLVGREANTGKMKIRVTPNSDKLLATHDYIVEVNGQEAKYTTDANPSVAEITAGLKAAVDALSEDVVTTDGTTHLDIEADEAGAGFRFYIQDRTLLSRKDLSPDGITDHGIVEDIAAVRAENDDWYTLHLCHQGAAAIEAAAEYTETLVRGLVATSGDDDILDANETTDIASTLQTAGYVRTMVAHHTKPETQHLDGAWAGKCLPYDPGSYTWDLKTLSGVDSVYYTDTEKSTMQGKNCNYYTEIAGLAVTQRGITPGDEWFDVINGIDWTQIRMQERIFARLAGAKKVPFTDRGIGIVENEVRGVLTEGVTKEIYTSDPAPEVSVPLAADISTADKALRILTGVTFRATLAGAIHEAVITGTVSV